jgi:hypothetical protein
MTPPLLPVAILLCLSAATFADPVDDALALIQSDAHAAVVIPHLKRTNDQITELLQQMDRPEILILGRPLDVLKAQMGIPVGVDEGGPAVISFLLSGNTFVPVAVFPVTDAPAFLKGNFDPKDPANEPDAWLTRDGLTIYAKVLDHRVALSTDQEAAAAAAQSPDSAALLRSRLGEKGSAMLSRGDAFLWADGAGITVLAQQQAANRPALPPGAPPLPNFDLKRLDGVKDSLVVIDFDPLGLVVRSWTHFEPGSELGRLALGGGGKDRSVSLSRIPDGPFYFAASIDLVGLGGAGMLKAVMPKGFELPDWLLASDGAQLGIYPSKLGVAVGGVLNDASLVIETAQPAPLREAIKKHVLATAGENESMKCEAVWEDQKTLKSGAVADAFEVKETVKAAANQQSGFNLGVEQMIKRIVFGQRGFHGFVHPSNNAVIMTFSQRPDVLDRAVAAATGGKALGANAMIAAMRKFLLPDADIELFVSVGQLGKLMKQVAGMVPGAADSVPDIDPGVEPIGFALEADAAAIETSLLIPAGVLTLFFDQAKAQFMPPPAPQPASAPKAQP